MAKGCYAPPLTGFKRQSFTDKTPKITNKDVRALGNVAGGRQDSSVDPNKRHRTRLAK